MEDQTTATNQNNKLQRVKVFLRTHLKYIGGAVLLLLIVLLIKSNIFNSDSQPTNIEKASILGAKKTQNLNKEYSFPLQDSNNIEVGNIKYTIENIQLLGEIVIKGQRATAVEGKTFLIINLKLTNSLNQPIQINTRDYIRLVIDGKDKDLIAPDIHNDPVEIQPISTKFTRVGIPINEKFKKIQLKVGEINGDKSTLDVKF